MAQEVNKTMKARNIKYCLTEGLEMVEINKTVIGENEEKQVSLESSEIENGSKIGHVANEKVFYSFLLPSSFYFL